MEFNSNCPVYFYAHLLDRNGIPRVYVWTIYPEEIQDMIQFAYELLDKYIKNKPYPINPNQFTLELSIMED